MAKTTKPDRVRFEVSQADNGYIVDYSRYSYTTDSSGSCCSMGGNESETWRKVAKDTTEVKKLLDKAFGGGE